MLEERVAGAGDEDPITRVAQQFEQCGVGITRAGGQHDAIRIDVRAGLAKTVYILG